MERLFTYGTLKRGQVRESFLYDQKRVGKCFTVDKFRLFHNGRYPCLCDKNSEQGYPVYGELYEINSNNLWNMLDRIEGVPDLYKREQIIVQDQSGQRFEAIVYVYQLSVEGLEESGRCWPVSELRHWQTVGKCVIPCGEGFRGPDPDFQVCFQPQFEGVHDPLTPPFKFNPLCDYCAENIEIFGGGKVSAQEWKILLEPFVQQLDDDDD